MDRINFENNSEERTLKDEFMFQKERYFYFKTKAVKLNNHEIQEYFDQIENEDMIGNIENFLQTSETDVDAQDNANNILKDFREILDYIEEIVISRDSWKGSWTRYRSATSFGSNNKWRDD